METDWYGRRLASTVAVATGVATGVLTVRGLLDPEGVLPGAGAPAARMLGRYLAVRNGVLAGAPVVAMGLGRWRRLRELLAISGVVQAADAALGVSRGRPETIGPAGFAAALLLAAARLRPSAAGVRA